jgi:hypothetical protein
MMTTTTPTDADLSERIIQAHERLVTQEPFTVKISGKPVTLTPHPAALTFPVLPFADFQALAEDVHRNGFTSEVVLTEDNQILEGRHRVAVASALGLSLGISWGEKHRTLKRVLFHGTDDEARTLVTSSNLLRRHLTAAQRALTVAQLYMAEATRQAEAAMKAGTKSSAGRRKAVDIAAALSGGLTNASAVRDILPVLEAPLTTAKVMTGKITSISAAAREAEAEIEAAKPRSRRKAAPTKVPTTTASAALSAIDTKAQALRDAVDDDRLGKTDRKDLLSKVTEVRDLLATIEEKLAAGSDA